MSYLIRYEGKSPSMKTHRRKKFAGIILCIAFAGLAAAKLLYPDFDLFLQQVIFPGSGENTMMLLEQAISSIRGGESVGNSLHTFCKEVTSNAAY